MNKVLKTIAPYSAVIPFFIYLLYVIGRTYITAYLNQLGIPSEIMKFSIDDYAFYGLKLGTIILTISFTIIFIGFIRFLILTTDDLEKKRIEKLNQVEKYFTSIGFIFLLYTVVAFVIFIFIMLGNNGPISLVFSSLSIVFCLLFIIWCFIFIFNNKIILFIKENTRMLRLFLVAISIELVFLPIIGSTAWGEFYANSIYVRFPKIQIQTMNQIDDISSILTSNQTFETNENLYWVIGDNERLILVDGSKNYYLINQRDIIYLKFIR